MSWERNKRTKKFFEIAMSDLKQNNIKLKWYARNIDSERTVGYFDENNMELAILKDRFWLETFVHEYAHFLQWKYDKLSFGAYSNCSYDPSRVIENYVNRRVGYNRKVRHAFNLVRSNEAECDRLAASLIKKHKLPIDLDQYRQKANHQIVFYHCVEQKRKWEPSPNFSNKKFREMLPNRIQTSYAQRLPKDLLETALKLF